MLLFTKRKKKERKKNEYFLKTGWSYPEINMLNFFFPSRNLELTDSSLNHTLFCMQLRMGLFMLHTESKECLVL